MSAVNQSKKTNSVAEELAQAMYGLSVVGEKKYVGYSSLDEEDKNAWVARAVLCLRSLDKMGLKVLSDSQIDKLSGPVKPEAEQPMTEDRRRKNIDTLTRVIKDFCVGIKTKRFDLFPAEELAHRIFEAK